MEAPIALHKVTLTAGKNEKTLYFGEMTQRVEETAMRAAEAKGGTSEIALGYYMSDEVGKLLLYGIEKDGKMEKLSATDLELYWRDLSYGEIRQVRKVVGKIMGEDGNAEPQIEVVSGGS